MPLGNNITNVLKGSTQVDRIMKGSTVVWENFKPVTDVINRGYKGDSVNRTTYTFSSVGIGAANPDRWVAVCIGSYVNATSPAISSVTIGGISAQLRKTTGGPLSTVQYPVGVAWAKVPSGSTAAIVVTMNKTAFMCAIQTVTFNAADLAFIDSATGYTNATVASMSNVACKKGGLVLSVAETSGVSYSFTPSWNGVDSAVRLSNGADTEGFGHFSSYTQTTEESTARDLTHTYNKGATSGAPSIAVSIAPP